MKKGFFSHQLCCGRSLLNKHILYLTMDNKIDSILPFQREISLTTFCEGLLFAVSPAFVAQEQAFIECLNRQLEENSLISVGEAILHNPIYRNCCINDEEPCLLYAITTIDWQTGRLHPNKETELLPVLK